MALRCLRGHGLQMPDRVPHCQRRHLYRGGSNHLSHQAYRDPSMSIKSLPACFVRGGTSNGLIIHRQNLPREVRDWQPILAAAMGSPDSYGRQLDGMGSGVSSTSKVCVVERSSRTDADLDYTFVQVGIYDGSIDIAGNCGNLSAAVGPFGLNEGLLHNTYDEKPDQPSDREVTVRIFNTNTSKIIHATFNVTKDGVYDPFGTYSIDGVPGTGSRITLSFLDPAGAKTGKTLPTGNPIDVLTLADGSTISASLVDVANPGVFVRATDLDIPGSIHPATLEADKPLMARLEAIRRTGAQAMGLDPETQSVPKIVIVSAPTEPDVHIVCRALSMQQPHKAVPLTLALNLGATCRIPGTIPAETAVGMAEATTATRESDSDQVQSEEAAVNVTLAHASGKVQVGSVFDANGHITRALLHRTTRVMMKGDVFYNVRS